MATIITVIANKGGVGKTTLTMAIASYLAKEGNRVLVIDLDSNNFSASRNLLTKALAGTLPGDRTVAALFDEQSFAEPEDVIHKSHLPNRWVVPANSIFEDYLETRPLEREKHQQFAVAEFLSEVGDRFDYVLIDSPPAIGNLGGWNCLTAAHYAVSPVQMEGYSAQSVVGVEEKVALALQHGNPNLRFLGYVVNLFEMSRKKDHAAAEEALRARYGAQVFETVIIRKAKLAQAQAVDEDIYSYAPKSSEAKMVTEFAKELLQRIEKTAARRAA